MLGQYVEIELVPFMGQMVHIVGRGKDSGLVARLCHFRVRNRLFKISMVADDVERETGDVLG